MPTVSIIIPTYNRELILQRAIRSALGQTLQNIEIIVVDDASIDNTETAVRSYDDPRIKYLRHSTNRGAPAARNTGIANSSGNYLAFLDSDNEWHPQRLEKQVHLFARLDNRVGVVYANNAVVDEVNCTESVWAFNLRGNLYSEFLQQPFMDFITPLIRRECFTKIGVMDESVPSYQEWDTFMRISRYYEFDFVPEVLATYYYHKGNTYSQDAMRIARGYDYVFKKHRVEMIENLGKRVMIEHYKNLAKWYKKGGAYGRMSWNFARSMYYRRS